VFIKDLDSGNGTFVKNRRIIECRLSDGDIINVGGCEVRYEAADESGPQEVGRSQIRFEESDPGMRFQAASAENVYKTFFSAPSDTVSDAQLRAARVRLTAIYEANQIIASERNLDKLFERVMDQIFSLVPAHNGVIMLAGEKSGELEAVLTRVGEDSGDVVISSTIVKRAFDGGEAVLTYDAADDSRFRAGASIISQNISSAMCVPLRHQEKSLGVVYVDTRGTKRAFEDGDLELLVALSGPAAIAIRNAQYLRQLQQAYQDTLVVTANTIEMRDHYTVGHTWRVTNFALEMARYLGWDKEQLELCRMGGVLHDVGKIAVDDAILRKPGRLTEEEFAKMKVHPERGARMMQDVESLKPLIPYCLYHHERYDGKGYPYGLAGEAIPIEGRIIAVADTFDAMTSNRPYRKGLDPEIAIAEIEKGKGGQFDPVCCDALITCYREGRIARILQDFYANDEKSIVCPFCSTFIRVDEGVNTGDVIECAVCHRRIRLMEENKAYYGETVPESEVPPSQ